MGDDSSRGQIIFLNGASSSGKSSIARALLPILQQPYFHLSVDAFNAMRDRRTLSNPELASTLERTVLGFHRAVAGMASAGNNVIVDHVLRERSWLVDCLQLFAGGDVVFVAVRCSLPELERREHGRGDRIAGRAANHIDRVHASCLYDLECDTEVNAPSACAELILAFLAVPGAKRVFDRMRASPEYS